MGIDRERELDRSAFSFESEEVIKRKELISISVPVSDPKNGHKWRQLQARHAEAEGSRVASAG